jgi:hypothetical protein
MKLTCLLLLGGFAIAAAQVDAAQLQGAPLQAGTAPPDPVMAAKCKAASYARRPAGQMATTMRSLQIDRCIKNKGFLD